MFSDGGNNVFQARQLPHCEHIVGGAGDGRVQIRCLNRNGCGKPVKQGDASSSSSTVLAAPAPAGPKRSPSTPLIQTPFLTCGEDGIGLRVRRRNERDQGRRDVPRLLTAQGVAQVGDSRPVIDGDTVGSPLLEGRSECQTPNRCSTLPRARFPNTFCITCLDYSCQGELLAT